MAGSTTHVIAVMGALGRGLRTLDELVTHLPIERRTIVKAAGKLVHRDYVEREEKGTYRLTSEGAAFLAAGGSLKSGPRGPHQGVRAHSRDTFRQRAWAAIRLQARFTQPDILMLAATPADGGAASNLQRYILLLLRAGYLAQLPERSPGSAETSNGYKLYRLVRNSGELAPMHRERQGVLRDPNTGEEFPCR